MQYFFTELIRFAQLRLVGADSSPVDFYGNYMSREIQRESSLHIKIKLTKKTGFSHNNLGIYHQKTEKIKNIKIKENQFYVITDDYSFL